MSGGRVIEVVGSGIQTTVQDYPGRRGMARQGFFPAGPMDSFAFRAANLLAGNPEGAAGLEVTLGNAAFRFDTDATVAVCGADADVRLDGEQLPTWESRRAPRGSELRLGLAPGPGFRMYVAVSGGIDVPPLFGSRATHTLGAVGGFEGRALRQGDRLPLGDEDAGAAGAVGMRFKESARPAYAREWVLETMRGPQASPDFLTEDAMGELFGRWWPVDRNSDRTGVRLESHKFRWAREGGGIAGGHPSNILDNSYPLGAININGDLPVILGPDGPTAGGFVVAGTVVQAALWKLGQLRPVGDRLRFQETTIDDAVELARELDDRLSPTSLEPA